MISLQTTKEDESFSKKRKWGDLTKELFSEKRERIQSVFDTDDLQNEIPLPLEWQRCLDIKSGQIYFYNTRTHERELGDPRLKPDPMSLELGLNLPCQSKNHAGDKYWNTTILGSGPSLNSNVVSRSPSWLTLEEDQQEMVTAVCKKCYMLVMMNKSSPSCPNCKFVHTDPTPKLFHQSMSLLC